MICSLYDLKKEYKREKIYIWNINRDSVNLFTMLAFRRIDIQGFITTQEEYENEIYMNRPVIGLDKIDFNENCIVFVADHASEESIHMLPEDKAVRWSDAVGVNEELKNERVIVYGIGYGSNQMCQMLEREGIEIELYCVTKRNQIEEYNGKKVIEACELTDYENYAVVISVITPQYRREILEALSDFPGQIYMEHIIVGEQGEPVLDHINFVQNIDLAVKKKRKIYIYSKRDQMAELVEDALKIYGIKISGYIYDIGDEKQKIESIYELSGGDEGDKLIIINENFPERLIDARENIEFMGFSLEKGNYTGIQWYTRAKEKLLLKMQYYRDSLVGYSIEYADGKPGWKVYGKETDDSIHILVLGGSTTAEVWHPENWVSKLYYRLKQDKIEVTIYNGAHEGNGVVEELLRLLRDGYVLRPQIVISFSGVNDLYYRKSANQFNEEAYINWIRSTSSDGKFFSGVSSDESLYSFWSRNVRMLKLVTESYGAEFFGFLQPMNLMMDSMTLQEKSLFEIELKMEGAREFAREACDDDGYINLMRLFEHREGMYFDMCHYTDRAHAIISNKVYESILPTIQRLIKEGKTKGK